MNSKTFLVLGSLLLAGVVGSRTQAAEVSASCVRIVELELDPAQVDAFTAALKTEVAASVEEPGVVAIYSVAEKDHPEHVRLFELYADDAAYKAHQGAAAFTKYKKETGKMIRSRKVIEATPIFLGAK